MLRLFQRFKKIERPLHGLMLTPHGMADDLSSQQMIEAMRRRGIVFDVIDPKDFGQYKKRRYNALFLHGGLAIRNYMQLGEGNHALLCPYTSNAIRFFYAKGRPIAAPCMSLSVAMEALRCRMMPAAYRACNIDIPGSFIYWRRPKLASTHRPMIGLDSERFASQMDRFLGLFVQTFFKDYAYL